MTTAQRIAKLKRRQDAQPLGVYQAFYPDLAAILEKAGPQNCWVLNEDNRWSQSGSRLPYHTYIHKDTYEPKPEYEEPLATLVAKILIIRNHCDDALQVLQEE